MLAAGQPLPQSTWMMPHEQYAFFTMDDLDTMGIHWVTIEFIFFLFLCCIHKMPSTNLFYNKQISRWIDKWISEACWSKEYKHVWKETSWNWPKSQVSFDSHFFESILKHFCAKVNFRSLSSHCISFSSSECVSERFSQHLGGCTLMGRSIRNVSSPRPLQVWMYTQYSATSAFYSLSLDFHTDIVNVSGP